jgi:hypothetical protein
MGAVDREETQVMRRASASNAAVGKGETQTMRGDRIFNSHKTHLMRHHIPGSENLFVALIFLALTALVAWVTTTRDDFDPTERDLPIELLGDNSRQIEIYNRPLRPWVEPGQPMAGAAFDLGPFPPRTLDDEWQPVGRIKRFQADNLYEKINGEAEKFIKQGFVELAFLRLRSASDASEIAIELFDQGNLSGSLGIFSEHAAGRVIEEQDGVSFVATKAGAIGRKGRHFFRIAGDRHSDVITDKATRLLTAFAQLDRDSAAATTREKSVAAGFALLSQRLGIAEADIQFEESNVFQYDFAQRFWFGKAGIGGDARLFLHIADSAAEAEDLIAALAAEHSYEYDQVESNGTYRLFRHRFLGSYFAVARRGNSIYGIENSADTAAIAALLERISEHLGDDER